MGSIVKIVKINLHHFNKKNLVSIILSLPLLKQNQKRMKNLQEKIEKSLVKLFFGERIKGEKLPIPRKFPERKFEQKDFEQWCNEFNVTCVHNRVIVHIN
jgi:hypothetical protein